MPCWLPYPVSKDMLSICLAPDTYSRSLCICFVLLMSTARLMLDHVRDAGAPAAAADHWLQWEASQLRPATYQGPAGPLAQQLAVLDAALAAAGPYLTGSSITLADVSDTFFGQCVPDGTDFAVDSRGKLHAHINCNSFNLLTLS